MGFLNKKRGFFFLETILFLHGFMKLVDSLVIIIISNKVVFIQRGSWLHSETVRDKRSLQLVAMQLPIEISKFTRKKGFEF